MTLDPIKTNMTSGQSILRTLQRQRARNEWCYSESESNCHTRQQVSVICPSANGNVAPPLQPTHRVPADSQQPPLSERHDAIAGDDKMVERADVDERQRLLQRLGEELVGA